MPLLVIRAAVKPDMKLTVMYLDTKTPFAEGTSRMFKHHPPSHDQTHWNEGLGYLPEAESVPEDLMETPVPYAEEPPPYNPPTYETGGSS